MNYENIIENYINGNLKDFYEQYKKIRKKLSFWEHVKNNYGEKIFDDAMRFLRNKEQND